MRHGSLFSGIGGFDLAAHWMGWQNVFHCEWNPFCQTVLKHHFPEADSHTDIKQLDATEYTGRIDILTGGFPCQPFSAAGQRKGRTDDRHLWPEMLRVIRETRPRWIVAENVRGLLSMESGVLFDEVLSGLANEGYSYFPALLPAAGVNAPHRRERIWIIAHAHDEGRSTKPGEVQKAYAEISKRYNDAESGNANKKPAAYSGGGGPSDATETKRGRQKPEQEGNYLRGALRTVEQGRTPTDSNSYQRCKRRGNADGSEATEWNVSQRDARPDDWSNFPSVSPLLSGNDGISSELDGISFSKWRRESIKAAGNAIVPQVAYQIFRTIEAIENAQLSGD